MAPMPNPEDLRKSRRDFKQEFVIDAVAPAKSCNTRRKKRHSAGATVMANELNGSGETKKLEQQL